MRLEQIENFLGPRLGPNDPDLDEKAEIRKIMSEYYDLFEALATYDNQKLTEEELEVG